MINKGEWYTDRSNKRINMRLINGRHPAPNFNKECMHGARWLDKIRFYLRVIVDTKCKLKQDKEQ